MNYTIGAMGLLMAVAANSAVAEDNAPKDGLALYNKECSVCHGVMSHANAGQRQPVASRQPARHLAMGPTGSVRADFTMPLWSHESDPGDGPAQQAHGVALDRIAVAPIYGPPLQGIIGRPAGTSERYTYSKAFLAKMDGTRWDEGTLDQWIKSSQTMVPGSYMFYSQKNPELRAKIIEYLKTR